MNETFLARSPVLQELVHSMLIVKHPGHFEERPVSTSHSGFTTTYPGPTPGQSDSAATSMAPDRRQCGRGSLPWAVARGMMGHWPRKYQTPQHLQGDESERLRLRRIMDRDSTSSSTRPRRVAPGRGQPVAGYFVMDLGMVGDILLRASIDTASPYNNKKFSCCFCLNHNRLAACFLFVPNQGPDSALSSAGGSSYPRSSVSDQGPFR